MKKNLLYLCVGLVLGAIAAAVTIRLITRTDTVFWSEEDMTVILNSTVQVRTDADTSQLLRELHIPKGTSFNDGGVGHTHERTLMLSIGVPEEDMAGLFHKGRVKGADLITDMLMLYERRPDERAEVQ
jgi:hypothetical protein